MTPPAQSKEVCFEIAIVDGINIFVREVLHRKGIISAERFAEVTSKDVLEEKYSIARLLAASWAKMPMTD